MSRMWVLPSWAKPQKLIRYCGEFSVNFLFFKMLWASVIMRHVESETAWPLQRNHHVDLSHTGSNEVVMKVSKHWAVLLLCLTRTCGFGYRHETLVVFLFFIRFMTVETFYWCAGWRKNVSCSGSISLCCRCLKETRIQRRPSSPFSTRPRWLVTSGSTRRRGTRTGRRAASAWEPRCWAAHSQVRQPAASNPKYV